MSGGESWVLVRLHVSKLEADNPDPASAQAGGRALLSVALQAETMEGVELAVAAGVHSKGGSDFNRLRQMAFKSSPPT